MNTSDPVRERIVDYAFVRFRRDGFAKVSVDEMSGDLGISKKTFYKFFKNKEDLVGVLADAMMTRINAEIIEIIEGGDPFPLKLAHLMSYVGQTIGQMGRALPVDLRRHAPKVWNRIEAFRRERMSVNIGGLLRQGMKQGYVRKDVNPRLFILTFLGAVESLFDPHVLADESFSRSDALEMVLKIVFQGILTEDASRAVNELHQTTVSSF